MAAQPISMPSELPGEIKALIDNLVCGDKIVHAAVVGTYAYVVISATLHLKLKAGQSGSRPGILTLTFAKQGDEWKIASQAWGRLS